MSDQGDPDAGRYAPRVSRGAGRRIWAGGVVALAILGTGALVAPHVLSTLARSQAAAPPPPSVAVSTPLLKAVDQRLDFLGQFAAINQVEIRPQVGGTLTQIRFKDGDIVHRGDILFQIDPVPYEIKLSQADAELEAANARLTLATRQLERAQTLKSTDAGSTENVDLKAAEKQSAQAAVDGARALVRDAKFDLDRTRVRAPFTGRIGTHLVSVGNLVGGSRAAAGPTTLLATLVSLDSVYLNFDMSEADYMTCLRQRGKANGPIDNSVEVALADDGNFSRHGTMTFVDNALDRSSGTIHARATVPNTDFLLTPGGFARVRLSLNQPVSTLFVPDAAVLPDQSDHVVMTVGPGNVVTPKPVKLGEMRDGLRAIRSGLSPADRVIIDGIPTIAPGAKITPRPGVIQFNTAQAQG